MNPKPKSTLADFRRAVASLKQELAERTAERDEGLAREAAVAEVLGVINSSPCDLAPVFDAMLEKAHSLCGVTIGVLGTYDGDCFRVVATHGLPEPLAVALREPFRPRPDSAHARLLSDQGVIHIPDLATETLRDRDDPIRTSALEAGVRTLLFVPLRKDGVLLGYISANRLEMRPFSDKQIALLQNFAAQAVIAIENARLLTETREALDRQTATAEVLQVINASPGDLAPVFDAMLERGLRLCDAAFGALRTWDGEYFNTVASCGASPALAEFWKKPLARLPNTVAERVAGGETCIAVPDLLQDEMYRRGAPGLRAMGELGGARSYVVVALRREEALLGLLALYRQEVRPFTDRAAKRRCFIGHASLRAE